MTGWTLMACAATLASTGVAWAQTPTGPQPTRDQEIAAAVLPLPAPLRAGAGVVRLDQRGNPQEWRPSRNGMVCLADEPGDSTFDVRCYHRSFIRLLYRARQLRGAGTPDSAFDATMDREIHGGKLRLPAGPTAGYRMLGPVSGFDWATATASDTIDAWQSIHFRTARRGSWVCPRQRTASIPTSCRRGPGGRM